MSRAVELRELPKRAAKAGQLCACFNIRKTARVITQLYDEELRPAGLRITQFALLMSTWGLEPVTVTRLAKSGVMDRTTLTRNLRPLEKQGLIRIEPGGDRRERQVRLTAQGQHALAKAFPLWEKAQARVARGFGQGRLQRLFTELANLRTVSRAV